MISRALELGATELAIPTAGNAGGALAAYAALAGAANDYRPAFQVRVVKLLH